MTRIPSAGEMMDAAGVATGLSDFGDDVFREPFEVLIAELNSETRLPDVGAEPADEEITAPVFVAGLPRSGTTFFHNLLAADPDNRSPATWEITYASPPPEAATYATDPRIADAQSALAFEGFMGEALQAVHPFD